MSKGEKDCSFTPRKERLSSEETTVIFRSRLDVALFLDICYSEYGISITVLNCEICVLLKGFVPLVILHLTLTELRAETPGSAGSGTHSVHPT